MDRLCVLIGLILVVTSLTKATDSSCQKTDWSSSFDTEGPSFCDSNWASINGFYRSELGDPDSIDRLDAVICCSWNQTYQYDSTLIRYDNWGYLLERDEQWVSCPDGFFLDGLYRSDGRKLENILDGRCIKPASHPQYYGHCYDEDIVFSNEGDFNCNEGYFITGLHKGSCDDLKCLDKFRCCSMSPEKVLFDSLEAVKRRVMEDTLEDLSYLAHFLGYGWSSGCKAEFVGEDFRLDGDVWKADKSARCSGYKSGQRLNIAYGDWSFSIKEIKYGDYLMQDLKPTVVGSGSVHNCDDHPVTKTVQTQWSSTRFVAHTKSSSWKQAHELGFKISYRPKLFFLPSYSLSYKFSYENAGAEENIKGEEHNQQFTVESSKEVSAYSSATWKHLAFNKKTSLNYTATIRIHFSVELRGFLREGGGTSGQHTNYHTTYRGSSGRPTFNYKFGDEKTNFYEALDKESSYSSAPWLWHDVKLNHDYMEDIIALLVVPSRYEFVLSGRFDDISGSHTDIEWHKDNVNTTNSPCVLSRKRRESPGPETNHTSPGTGSSGDTKAPKEPRPINDDSDDEYGESTSGNTRILPGPPPIHPTPQDKPMRRHPFHTRPGFPQGKVPAAMKKVGGGIIPRETALGN